MIQQHKGDPYIALGGDPLRRIYPGTEWEPHYLTPDDLIGGPRYPIGGGEDYAGGGTVAEAGLYDVRLVRRGSPSVTGLIEVRAHTMSTGEIAALWRAAGEEADRLLPGREVDSLWRSVRAGVAARLRAERG